MGSCADHLNIRQDQPLDFALTPFRQPSSNRKGQAGWSLSSGLSYVYYLRSWSFPRGSKNEAAGKRWSSAVERLCRRAVIHRRWMLACAPPRVGDATLALRPLRWTERYRYISKLVKLVGSLSTRADKVSPYLSSTVAASSIRLRIFVSECTSASAERRGC